jgi:Ca-activated chloride channel family protein
MTFIWPVMLLLLLFVPLFVAIYLRLQRRRLRIAASFGSTSSLPRPGRRTPAGGRGLRRHFPAVFFLAGLTILILALARPQAVVNLPRVEGTVILAFDVSGSMAADDLQPTRMDAAKAAAREFVQRQPASVQVGVVAFSEGGLSVQAPTSEQEAILAAIDRLSPQRGTSLGQGILASLNTIFASKNLEPGSPDPDDRGASSAPTPTPTPVPEGTYTSAVIVLLTDGENNAPPDPLAAAQAAADRGVRIHTIGIGSPAGTTLHVNGFTVHTQLNEAMLQQIALLTDGQYYNAATEAQLDSIYQNLTPELVVKPEYMEVTSLFAGASILILLIGGAFSLAWFSRLP